MTEALRWTRYTLLSDVIVMVALAAFLSCASGLGFNIEPFKWPVVAVGGALMFVAALLSILALALQIIVAFQRHPEVN